jgi:formylglycine-generating enzyme required for sulfatase activity
MVLVPGASFTMGRDDGSAAEAPAHQVIVGTFYMDQHEVTAGQYLRFLRETNRKLPEKGKKGRNAPAADGDPGLPVVSVTFDEAQDYARWAGKAIPTEAQWELAARTPDGRPYPWGSTPPSWERPRAPRQIDPVMAFPSDQSPYGAFDLAGNAWEWVSDWYDASAFQAFRTTPANDPIGPVRSKARPPQRTIKGSSKTWQSSWREGMKVDARLAFLGFRCALALEHAAAPVQAQAEGAAQPANPAVAPPGTLPQPAGGGGVIPF